MNGAYTLATWPADQVVVRCDHCGREGRYARLALIGRYGLEMSMPELLRVLAADCKVPGSGVGQPCRRVYYVDPDTGRPWARWA